ncbi:MAG: hypothetical protein ACJ790_07995 [Myxococcaceae bacterium]
MRNALLVSLSALLLLSCGKTPENTLPPLALQEGCQPLLGGHDCLLPYPSDFFRVEDATMPSGHRIEITKVARVRTAGGPADPNLWHAPDGYSHIPTVVAAFPSGVLADGFIGINDDYAKSVADDSQTLWIEVGTHERIAHFVDLDPRAKSPERQALVMHPVVGLKENTRYVIVIRHAKAGDGSVMPTPEGFRRIRDHLTKGDPQLEPLAARFDAEVFPELEASGIARDDIQLAWDFTTGSTESVTTDMLQVRAQTLEWLKTHTPTVAIESVDLASGFNDTWKVIRGTVEAPLFMESADPGAAISRDANGKVAQNGTVQFKWVSVIPNTVRDAYEAGRPVLYGHGFFGSRDEITYGGIRDIEDKTKSVFFAIDWWGMSGEDVGVVAGDITGHPQNTLRFSDRLHQAMANWIVFTKAIEGPMRALPDFARPQSGVGTSTGPNGSNAGQPVYGAKIGSYLGISQGHILGGTMAALNPSLDRIVLNVGGCGFTHMMMRAVPFKSFLLLIESAISDPLDQQKFIAQLQPQFDRIDPGTYAGYLLKNQLPENAPDRRVLFQTGLGDLEVPNLGAFLHARLIGLPLLQPSPRQVFGLPTVDAPTSQSAVTLFDFGHDTNALYKDAQPAADDNDVHQGVRALPAAQNQMIQFWNDGTIVNPCVGACDPQ